MLIVKKISIGKKLKKKSREQVQQKKRHLHVNVQMKNGVFCCSFSALTTKNKEIFGPKISEVREG